MCDDHGLISKETVYALGGLKGFTRANIVDPALTVADSEYGPGGISC
jgi:hypothetical protein